ncbi:hypothetical protein JOE68_006023 [Saccharothrix algeriensis]|uniref:Uncharacterized protein n=1 Tax=Saccharothrix algeriensis TaxID=173560 RepID=A0ABS2SFY2_9PSEU|nr:hypothetical protein [Saccharothrix algeriensis]
MDRWQYLAVPAASLASTAVPEPVGVHRWTSRPARSGA